MESRTIRIIAPLVVLFAALLLLMPRSLRFGYDYRQGSEWNHETLISQFPFPLLKTEDQLLQERQAASTTVVPYYRQDEKAHQAALAIVDSLSNAGLKDMAERAAACLQKLYSGGIVPEEGVRQTEGSSSEVIFVQKGKRAFKVPVSEVTKLSEAREQLLAEAGGAAADSLFRAAGLYEKVVPNLLYDSEMTRLVAADRKTEVSPTLGYVPAGQVIVSQGEMVTEEIAQMLDSYKREYESNAVRGDLLHWAGNAGIALAIVLLLAAALWIADPRIFERRGEYGYILLVVLLVGAGALLAQKFNPRALYAVPFTLGALFLRAFFDRRTAFAVYPVALLPLLVTAENGIALYSMFLVAGTLTILIFKSFSRRWKQFLMALITAVVLSLMFLAFRLVNMATGSIWQTLLMLFIGSMLTVAGYPLTFLFERIFNLVSDARLEELCTTSNPLLTRLEQKAPGTFQHSLQVMNMADAAARSIGASQLLVRAGALYHDIGKMENPLCFIENESMLAPAERTSYHASLTPLESVRDITRHVAAGLEMAEKSGLPGVIKDFIRTHHGTTVMSFFYEKHLKEGGRPEDMESFRYDGMLPQTREQLILMVADSIEAASRTLKDYSSASLSELVEGIVRGKMEEGQFARTPITLSELDTLKEALKGYLGQMFHERIAYPEKSNNSR